MKKISVFLLTLAVCAIITRCGSDAKPNSGPEISTEKQIVRRLHPDSLTIVKKSGFCYFIPRDLKPGMKPLIFFFDPHAKGENALKRYAGLAGKYGIILGASNISQNGMPLNEIQQHFTDVMRYFTDSLGIKKQNVILAGFSGGARVAVELSKLNAGIMGSIACGAANETIAEVPVRTAVVCGNLDFNYVECVALAMQISSYHSHFMFASFHGIHAWPEFHAMDQAVSFCMGKNTEQQGVNLSKEELLVLQLEQRERADLLRFFSMKPTTWWMNTLKNLKSKSVQEGYEAQSATRLLAYIGMICYTYTKSALNKGNEQFIKHCLLIYENIEPTNPDMFFYKACYFAMSGQRDASFNALESALNNDLVNKIQIKTSPFLKNIRMDTRYALILQKYGL